MTVTLALGLILLRQRHQGLPQDTLPWLWRRHGKGNKIDHCLQVLPVSKSQSRPHFVFDLNLALHVLLHNSGCSQMRPSTVYDPKADGVGLMQTMPQACHSQHLHPRWTQPLDSSTSLLPSATSPPTILLPASFRVVRTPMSTEQYTLIPPSCSLATNNLISMIWMLP